MSLNSVNFEQNREMSRKNVSCTLETANPVETGR